MSKPGKKVTYKELNDRMSLFFQRLQQVHQNVDYVHTLTLKYIQYRGDDMILWILMKFNRYGMRIQN